MKAILQILTIAICLASCGTEGVESLSDDLSQGWAYETAVEMTADSPADLLIVHGDDYGYQNLYMTLSTKDWSDTVSVRLADKKGYWAGKKWKGSAYQLRYELPSDISYPISVHQHSRDSILMGIQQIGLIAKDQ